VTEPGILEEIVQMFVKIVDKVVTRLPNVIRGMIIKIINQEYFNVVIIRETNKIKIIKITKIIGNSTIGTIIIITEIRIITIIIIIRTDHHNLDHKKRSWQNKKNTLTKQQL